MSARLAAFAPGASEAVQVAAHAQHVRRWDVPRSDFPMDRRGYLRWRTRLSEHHARVAAPLLREVGYDEAFIERVADLLRKNNLHKDPEAQLIEDVACLVFLEHHLDDFAREHEREKVIQVLRRSWAKMSPSAHESALALSLSPSSRALIEAALGSG